MQEASPLCDITNRGRGRKKSELTPEEKKRKNAERMREKRAKTKKAKEEHLLTPEGQAEDR